MSMRRPDSRPQHPDPHYRWSENMNEQNMHDEILNVERLDDQLSRHTGPKYVQHRGREWAAGGQLSRSERAVWRDRCSERAKSTGPQLSNRFQLQLEAVAHATPPAHAKPAHATPPLLTPRPLCSRHGQARQARPLPLVFFAFKIKAPFFSLPSK